MKISRASVAGPCAALFAALLAHCQGDPPSNGPLDAALTDSPAPSDLVESEDAPPAPAPLGALCATGEAGACQTGLTCQTVTSDSPGHGVCTRSCSPLRDPPECVAAGAAGRTWSCPLFVTGSTPGTRCVARCGSTVSAACPEGTVCRTDGDSDGSPDLCTPPPNAGGDSGTPPTDTPPPLEAPYLRAVCNVSGGVYRVCLGTMFLGEPMNTISAGVESPATSFVSIPIGSQRSSFEVQSVRTTCLDISSSRVSFTSRAGAAYTVFGGQIGVLPRLIENQAPPPAGSVRLRAYSTAMGAWASGLDVCTSDGGSLLAGVTRASNPTAVVPPQPSGVVVRLAATPACSGAVVGTLPMSAAADRAYSLFFVGSASDSALLSVWCPDPVPGVSAPTLRCSSARLRP